MYLMIKEYNAIKANAANIGVDITRMDFNFSSLLKGINKIYIPKNNNIAAAAAVFAIMDAIPIDIIKYLLLNFERMIKYKINILVTKYFGWYINVLVHQSPRVKIVVLGK